MTTRREHAEQLDAADQLAPLREQFQLPPNVVYLDGNSLGALVNQVPDRLADVVTRQWGDHLIRAWNEDAWWQAPIRIGDRIGKLLGAGPGQVVVGESTSIQFFQALTAAARLRSGRRLVLSDLNHFPTNRYLAASVARLLGLEILEVSADDLQAALREHGSDVCAISFGAVDFRTGALLDIPQITEAAHSQGALVVWDVCHAVGAVPLECDADQVDLAVGCTYKYLNGGPGSPAFLYAAARHHAALDLPLTGWHGHADPFGMTHAFEPAEGIAKARVGTLPMLSLLALDAALDVFDGVDLTAVQTKSQDLGDFFLECLADLLNTTPELGVVSPRRATRRGSQVTLSHPEASPVMAALIARGVIGDVRPPGLLRFGWNSLYIRYQDLLHAVEALETVLSEGEHRRPEHQVPRLVT
ncbi:kynureninase [Gordonia oryzae]|uniref:Kynureninase n=1 Tax=Gordonia oryzae TaxID=2487349 RepID=A0A3N4GU66_9ACTN|nr:kynureninase [Gordonia oryzae]RPA66342.1 kynureninase [Gordonia oryzae]